MDIAVAPVTSCVQRTQPRVGSAPQREVAAQLRIVVLHTQLPPGARSRPLSRRRRRRSSWPRAVEASNRKSSTVVGTVGSKFYTLEHKTTLHTHFSLSVSCSLLIITAPLLLKLSANVALERLSSLEPLLLPLRLWIPSRSMKS